MATSNQKELSILLFFLVLRLLKYLVAQVNIAKGLERSSPKASGSQILKIPLNKEFP